jgi:hypothetical protein
MKKIGLFVLVLIVLILPQLAFVAICFPGAAVTMTWSDATSRLLITINSPVGVGAAQVVLNVPSELGVGVATLGGFMTGATYLSSGTEHRWFQLQANGQQVGTVEIPITIPPSGGTYTITLTTIGLKDAAGNIISVDTSLPTTIQVPQAGFDFTLSSSGGFTVAQGGSGSNNITVTLTSGTSQVVTLSASTTSVVGFSVIVSFNPSSSNPTFTSTCTVRVSPSAPRGSYPVTVIAAGGGVTRTTSFTLTIIEPGQKGSTRIVLDASPKSGYVNKPVTIFGTLYGSWRRIRGVVVGASVEITTDWGLRTSAVTNDQGQFSVTANCSSAGGTYTITATFYEDQDLSGSSASIQYQVVAKIETTLSLSCVRISYGMGLAAKFYGFLTEKSSGAPVAGKTIHLTVFGGGSGWTYAVTTNSAGYYEYTYTNNSGMFNWAEASFNGDDPYLPSSSGRI